MPLWVLVCEASVEGIEAMEASVEAMEVSVEAIEVSVEGIEATVEGIEATEATAETATTEGIVMERLTHPSASPSRTTHTPASRAPRHNRGNPSTRRSLWRRGLATTPAGTGFDGGFGEGGCHSHLDAPPMPRRALLSCCRSTSTSTPDSSSHTDTRTRTSTLRDSKRLFGFLLDTRRTRCYESKSVCSLTSHCPTSSSLPCGSPRQCNPSPCNRQWFGSSAQRTVPGEVRNCTPRYRS